MEEDGLVVSTVQPGPHGPDRRVYSLGARGENRLRDMLKDSINVIMHFYDAYRHSLTGDMHRIIDTDITSPSGRILFSAVPRVRETDLNTIKYLAESNGQKVIDILGESAFLESAGVRHKILKGNLCDIPSPNERYAQIWINGFPDHKDLQAAALEFKRVLMRGGVLKLLAPFVYFDKPDQPDLGEFVRATAIQLFPELGMADGNDVGMVLESVFPDCGALDIFPGLVVLWARKEA
jgi:DNA-binding PadR family transcriptional regulator